ncbi:hypothetical protein GCM10025868_32860 [Angustibacter aerolatus]|uniref:Uncharacterized protein n=1 Tax=Angustibacter aerolatus TaxID=1162965 RepID=A0ABQ6JKE7_9ACTN|nr:hypothetical protein GCM10025868_32860 [Angustibacter aerolatus]
MVLLAVLDATRDQHDQALRSGGLGRGGLRRGLVGGADAATGVGRGTRSRAGARTTRAAVGTVAATRALRTVAARTPRGTAGGSGLLLRQARGW